MAKKFDVVATVGTYQKDGETKYISRNVGAIIDTKYGPKLKLASWFNPAGCPRDEDGQIWLALFEPQQEGCQDGRQAQGRAGGGGESYSPNLPKDDFEPDSDIPFVTRNGVY
jgi:single-strand DNA-binding protein